MNTLAIETITDDKPFNSYIGRIKIEINFIGHDMKLETYYLRIQESVSKEVTEPLLVPKVNDNKEMTMVEESVTHVKILDKNPDRIRYISYQQLDQIANALDITFTPNNLRANIDQIFLHGLLLYTQQECIKGISQPGVGNFLTVASDWKFVGSDEVPKDLTKEVTDE